MDNYQYPSVTLSRRYTGDRDLSTLYRGESDKLLYQLKNLMQFRQLGQLKMTRLFTDGTVITAWSIFGQDFVNVDVSRTIPVDITEPVVPETPGQCTITFVNLPSYVQPMRYPGVIMAGEVEGVDYHKTYYTIDTSNCPTCRDIVWEFLFRYLQSSPLVPLPEPPLPISTRIEWPIEPLHRHDYDANGLLLDHDGTDHTVYSLEPSAWGEIIKRGTDDGGTYIIWKAYTEAKGGIISRTGLGIMRLIARIKDGADLEMCAQNARIEVDCCLKDDVYRPLEMHWTKCTLSAWCPAPDVTFLSELIKFQYWSWIEMPLKAAGDSCIPYEWTLSGMGEIVPTWGDKKTVLYKVPTWQFTSRDCREQLSISVDDRCGTSDSVLFKSCCDSDPAPLSMGYTSLLMSCSGKQTLTANGGCGPYDWSLSGGGTLVPSSLGSGTAIYTAPATNANCANNPTIQVTDCCGATAEIKLAVNCYIGGTALRYCFDEVYTCIINAPACDPFTSDHRVISRYEWSTYSCDGVLISWDESNVDGCCQNFECPSGCHFVYCPPGTTQPYGVKDLRTQAMKNGGCCPINPITGLPY